MSDLKPYLVLRTDPRAKLPNEQSNWDLGDVRQWSEAREGWFIVGTSGPFVSRLPARLISLIWEAWSKLTRIGRQVLNVIGGEDDSIDAP